MSNPTEARAVERVILVNIKEGISESQLDIVAQHGVEQVSFATALHPDASYQCYVRIRFHDLDALQVYETHPNHAAFGLQEWLPIIADEILVDYAIAY
jgi:hypothetical protein